MAAIVMMTWCFNHPPEKEGAMISPGHGVIESKSGSSGLAAIGAAFGMLGVGAALLPRTGWVTADVEMGLVLSGWSLTGLGFVGLLRPIPEWRAYAVFFACLLCAGLVAVQAGPVGPHGLTMLIVIGLLAHGVLSVLFGLHLSGQRPGWRSAVASGVCALGAGLFMIAGWPDRSVRLVGLLLGATFLATSVSFLRMARAALQ
ncbi:hypothetical protein RGUI_0479 [Rhodovulum sp. P5]|uniref:hypothetical protein n=1 Tax=Rhodovulum sp. P5 TaxID=1564506 RepID=UPI0009C266A8|nr:hypothetical protein [Rhodovulum sp. P5]ARE38620.1 hypothetical protein RGUI_0479 [Rhodovulum sp. P5]